jgi:predicted aspartyl protease
MGLTHLTLEIAAPADPARRESVDFLVDAGAIYSFVPRAVLERLAIAPHGRQKFRLADGTLIERDRGDAIFFSADRRGAAPVIFAENGDATLLGAVTLESLGLAFDAVRRALVPLPRIVAAARAA